MLARVTVLMTVYNGGSPLRAAVASVLSQTFSDFEFLIVDNASTDGTVDYLKSLSDPRVRLLLNEANQGQTRALNRGIREARGEFLARMDADDFSMPDRLENQVAYLDNHRDVSVVGGWHDEIDENGAFLKRMRYPTDPLEIKCHLLSDGNLTRRCMSHPTVMFRTEALREMNGYDESIKFAQDYELWTRLVRAHDIANLPRVVLKYRVSQHSTSNKNHGEMTRELDRIVSANINRIWPGIAPRDHGILLQMLRNRWIEEPISLTALEKLFDSLFDRLFAPASPSARALLIRDRIKTYYLPRRLAKEPLRSLFRLGGRSLCQPSLWLDPKLHKNFLKIVVRR